MKLVVFDLDGTLTRTSQVDGECYSHAVIDVLGIEELNSDWAAYREVTDEGILLEVVRERFGRLPTAAEREAIQALLVELFAARCAVRPSDFAEVPGAGALVRNLLDAGWAVAVATGAWRPSAEFKIRQSGVPVANLPAAFAEDGPSRESVVNTAIQRALGHYRCQRFDRIVSVGDGIWDLSTARKLGFPFLGVADEPHASVLRSNGASHVVGDFREPAMILRLLHEAAIPEAPSRSRTTVR